MSFWVQPDAAITIERQSLEMIATRREIEMNGFMVINSEGVLSRNPTLIVKIANTC